MIDLLKQNLITIYKEIGDKKGLLTLGKAWTGNELAKEIEEETEFGIELVQNLISLTVDLLSREKLKYYE